MNFKNKVPGLEMKDDFNEYNTISISIKVVKEAIHSRTDIANSRNISGALRGTAQKNHLLLQSLPIF